MLSIQKIFLIGFVIALSTVNHLEAQIACPTCAAGDVIINIASGVTYSTAIAPAAGKNVCITGPASGAPAILNSAFTFNGSNIVCISGRVNISNNFSSSWSTTPKFIINTGAVVTHTGTFDLSGSSYGYKTGFYNYGSYSNTNASATAFKLANTDLYNSGTLTIANGGITIATSGSNITATNTSTGDITMNGKLDVTWGGSDIFTFTNQGKTTATCYKASGTAGNGFFNNPTGSVFTLTGTDGACGGNGPFDSGVTKFSINGTLNVPNGTVNFTSTSSATDLSGARMYVKNFVVPSHIFNTTPACLSVQVSDKVTINAGNTYIGNIFIWDQSFTSTTVNNGDTYAGSTLGCIVGGAGATGCASVNSSYQTLMNAANKVYYSATDNGSSVGCPTLPVTFVSFNAVQTDNGNLLTWTTAEEVNAQSFIVERSFDGVNFEAIGTVNAQGNTTMLSNYQYIDKEASYGEVAYYRLNEIDRDGRSMYSSIVAVQSKKGQIAVLLGNPVKDEIKIQLLSSEDNLISLIDSRGAMVFEKVYSGSQLVSIKSQFVPGMYFVKVTNDSESSSMKVIVE